MELLFRNNIQNIPKVSIVLLDWSVRESFHVLHYLNEQSVAREQYEIIWIEYYDRKAKEIDAGLKECASSGKHPFLDTWIKMDMPKDVYYHKHLMYNVGIAAGNGRIITFMDSDAVVSPTFIGAIINSFEKNSNQVLHMDQVRNVNRKYYPFNYPSIPEISSKGCINIVNNKPAGLFSVLPPNPSFIVNYGACMSALRDDLIAIGGADEHIDYLGHICGPYEMTFRLFNTGKKVTWHQNEFLYHTWHPGQGGDKNYIGPSDGRNVSTTALDVRRTGRILPLVENQAIKAMRLGQDNENSISLLELSVSKSESGKWAVDKLKAKSVNNSELTQKGSANRDIFSRSKKFVRFWLLRTKLSYVAYKIFLRQFYKALLYILKANKESPETNRNIWHLPREVYRIRRLLLKFNDYVMWRCSKQMTELSSRGIKEVAVFGAGDIAEILDCIGKILHVTADAHIGIGSIYDERKKGRLSGIDIFPVESLKDYKGKVIVPLFDFFEDENLDKVKNISIDIDQIVILW